MGESSDDLTGKSVLVTGSNGFLGSHLVSRLSSLGAHITAGVRPGSETNALSNLIPDLTIAECDVAELDSVRRTIEQSEPEYLFHLAALGGGTPVRDPLHALRINVEGTLNVLQVCSGLPLRRAIFLGSGLEYGDHEEDVVEWAPLKPAGIYAATKAAGSLLCQSYHRTHDVPACVLRVFNAYGPRQAPHLLIPHVILTSLRGLPVPLTGGEQVRDFVYAADVAEACIAAAVNEAAVGQVFNVCTGQGVRLLDLAHSIAGMVGTGARLDPGAIPYPNNEVWHCVGQNGLIHELLGWTPKVPLQKGLLKTIEAYR